MRRLMTMLGICACIFAPAAAFGQTHTWIGQSIQSTSRPWLDAGNWNQADYPGAAASKTALIADATYQAQVDVDGSVPWDVLYVEVNAETANADMTLQIASDGDLDVLNSGAGYIQLVAGTHTDGGTVADDAKLETVDTGTDPLLDADYLNLDGGSSVTTRGDRGMAIVDLDVDFCLVGASSGADVQVSGDVDIDLAAGVVFGARDVELENGADLIVTGFSSTSEMRMQSFNAATSASGTLRLVGPIMVTIPASYDCP